MKGTSWGLISPPDVNLATKGSARLDWRIKMFDKYPHLLRNKTLIAIFLPIVSFLFLFMHLYFEVDFLAPLAVMGIFLTFFFTIIYVVIRMEINIMKPDLIRYSYAKGKGWLFDPFSDYDAGKNFLNKYPLIFNKADSHYVDQQTWGSYNYKGIIRKFHFGDYAYVKESVGRNRTSERAYPSSFFAIKLEKKIKSSFLLYPETTFSRFSRSYSKKEINVESIDFNKTFAFKYEGSKELTSNDIVKVLSPVVQEELVKLSKQGKRLSVLFSDDVIIFSFKGDILRRPKSKLIGGFKLSQKDINIIDSYVESFNLVAGEIVSKLSTPSKSRKSSQTKL